MRAFKIVGLALVLLFAGVAENWSILGMLPFVSTQVAAAQYPPTNTLNHSTDMTMMTGAMSAVATSNAAEVFFPLSGIAASQVAAAEGDVQNTVSAPMVLSQLNCYLTNAGGTKTVAGGTSWVMAARDNATDTAVTCTIGAAATSCTDVTHTVAVAAGDQLDFSATPSGTPTALVGHCSIQAVF